MKVLLVSTELPPGPGGIGAHAHHLAEGGRRLGWDVTVLGPQDYVSRARAARFRTSVDYEIIPLASGPAITRHAFGRLRAVRRVLRATRPDLVMATGERSLWLAALLVRHCPWVAIGHGVEFGTTSAWRRRLTRWALGRCSAAVANSAFTREQLLSMGTTPAMVEVILPGADTHRFSVDPDAGARVRSRLDLVDAPVIVTVGNVTERKGQDIVVRALAERGDGPLSRAHYVLVGLPTEAASIRALADRLGVGDRVHLVGALPDDDLDGVLNAADVFAMTSRHSRSGDFEGFGIAVIEAALTGTPAVVSGGSGLTEAVADGETGIVVPPDDPGAAATALDRLLGDDDLRAAMGAAARRRAVTHGGWGRMADRYAEVAARLVADLRVESRPRLLMISDTPHHVDGYDVLCWGAMARELEAISGLFSEIAHVAPLHAGDAPDSFLPLDQGLVPLFPVRPSGGTRLLDKVRVVTSFPAWYRTIRRAHRKGDLIHVRCPSGISSLALVVLATRWRGTPAWLKYAINWRPHGPEPLAWRLQRRLLERGLPRAAVTVNGRWPGQPPHVHTFINPTLTDRELAAARAAGEGKDLTDPVRLLFVGRLARSKGPVRAVEVVAALRRRGVEAVLDVVGEGQLAEELRARSRALGVEDAVVLHGGLRRSEIDPLYARAHFVVLPTESEGFPKVLSEGMAAGAVPLAGAISAIPQTLADLGVGAAIDPMDVEGFADAVTSYLGDPARWRRERDAAMAGAAHFGYRAFRADLHRIFTQELGVRGLGPARPASAADPPP